jgi:signal transduction histidine kinase
VALVILLVILFWNYRLKREIQKRIEIEKKLFEANKNLKKLDQLKNMFVASMSHELRTPLNSIIGFTGIILQGMTGSLNDKQQDHLGRVYSSAKHLLALITDVIDISKIEAGRIDVFPEDINLCEIVDEAVININPQLKTKSLELKISVPNDLQMHTDRKKLLQCIINYLSNAVKFTEAGSITISAEKLDDKVEILVTDTGIGISQPDQSKLFEAFERLDSHLRVKDGGTGLGLYLTRKLAVEILDGEILVRSRQGRGSTFGLRVPINLAPADS